MASSCKSLGEESGLFHDWSGPLPLHEPVNLDTRAIVRYTGIRVKNPFQERKYVLCLCQLCQSGWRSSPQSEVDYDVASEQTSYRQSLYDHYHEPSDEYIKKVYGLEPDEWAGSSANRVRTIINKNSFHMEQQVNNFLRDRVAVFDSGMERLEFDEDADLDTVFDTMYAHGFTFSYDLCRGIKEAVESGVLIDAETMSAIKQVEDDYVIPFGSESLASQYERLRELNDVRKYYRETVPSLVSSHAEKKPGLSTLAAQEIADFSVITGGSAHGHGFGAMDVPTGRDTDGQPLASPTPSQGSRQGSIAAVLPGSSITVGRQAPRVRSTSVSHKSAPQRSNSYEADDGFEL